mgnify:CR=1 FL=1
MEVFSPLQAIERELAAVARAIEMSHDKYCSATIMLGKTAAVTTSHEIISG